MIQRIHLWSCTLKWTRASAEQIAEDQRKDSASQMDEEDNSSDDADVI